MKTGFLLVALGLSAIVAFMIAEPGKLLLSDIPNNPDVSDSPWSWVGIGGIASLMAGLYVIAAISDARRVSRARRSLIRKQKFVEKTVAQLEGDYGD